MRLRFILTALTALASLSATALQPGAVVDNFELLDQHGAAHELHYLSDMKAVALLSHRNGCAAQQEAAQAFDAARRAYGEQGVEFLLIDSAADARTEVEREAAALGIEAPVLLDDAQIIGTSLGLERTGEALLVRTDGWTLAWRGAPAQLGAAINAVLVGEAPPASKSGGAGCALDAPPPSRQISYAEDVAPILLNNCVTCHRAGGIGPWAMTDYNMVHGFSPMIREVIRTKRMPPWHADPAHGSFANDRSLGASEVQTLVRWIEAGSPRGAGPDPLAEQDRVWPEWGLGEPDLVIDIPAYDVPASGVVDYQYLRAKNPLQHDVWVRATEIQPGDRQALHHVITRFTVPAPGEANTQGFGRGRSGGLGGYVPGSVVSEYPAGTGTLLPAGANIVFQMHYTPYGKATTDRSRLGLYLHDEPPEHQLRSTALVNTKIKIPPHAKAHSDSQSYTWDRPVLVYNMLPHAHYRGKASNFVAHYPDGSSETLLSVPAYDFNWQTSYRLTEPKRLPAGTKVVHTTTWDNSAQNPANPDPNREVPWGRQSWDEMLFGAISFRYLDEDEAGADLATTQAADGGTAGE